jgi:hypothetical protein
VLVPLTRRQIGQIAQELDAGPDLAPIRQRLQARIRTLLRVPIRLAEADSPEGERGVRTHLRDEIPRIGCNVLGVCHAEVMDWAERRATPDAVLETIVHHLWDENCTCATAHADFDIPDRQAARARCREGHRLSAWDLEALDDFICRAIVSGPLCHNHLARVAAALGSPPTPAKILASLTERIEELLRRFLPGIGEHVFRLEPREARAWALGTSPSDLGEAAVLASQIAPTLFKGTCDCWERWNDFTIESAEATLRRCRTVHTLAGWDPDKEIDRWLFEVVLGGPPDNANGFRKGMLAPALWHPHDGTTLEVGPVLE